MPHIFSSSVLSVVMSSVGQKFGSVFSLLPESFGYIYYIYITTIIFSPKNFGWGKSNFGFGPALQDCRNVFCSYDLLSE